jgi:hypothetical protein
MALTGQIVNDVEATQLGDSLLKPPSDGYYRQPLDDADPIGTSKALSSTIMQESQSFSTLCLFIAKRNLFYPVRKKTRREQMHLNQALISLVCIH